MNGNQIIKLSGWCSFNKKSGWKGFDKKKVHYFSTKEMISLCGAVNYEFDKISICDIEYKRCKKCMLVLSRYTDLNNFTR